MKPTLEKHTFALIWNNPEYPLSRVKPNNSLTIADPNLCHRIQAILRLKINDQFILFDHYNHLLVSITTFTKKEIIVAVQEVFVNKILQPDIICVLPLLKREALETSMDLLTQLGATSIQLITTQKTQRSSITSKEFERLQRIIWSGAEQSKNFLFPTLKPPVSFNTLIKSLNLKDHCAVFCDPQGETAFTVIETIKKNAYAKISLIIGPEGDLTEEEKNIFRQNNILFMALTPTILRAEQAIALGLGIVRSLINK